MLMVISVALSESFAQAPYRRRPRKIGAAETAVATADSAVATAVSAVATADSAVATAVLAIATAETAAESAVATAVWAAPIFRGLQRYGEGAAGCLSV